MLLSPLFAIKLLLTPVLMLLVSLAAKKWGGFFGGLLSGLPLTSGVIITFLALEQGTGFAKTAILGAIPGLAAVLLTYSVYVWCSQNRTVATSCGWALLAFVLSAMALLWAHSTGLAVAVIVVAIAKLLQQTQTPSQAPPNMARNNRWDIPLRMLASTVLLLLITSAAQALGPLLSGVLAAIPVIAWPLTLFSHAQNGRHAMLVVVRGNAIGAVGVLCFYAVSWWLLGQVPWYVSLFFAATASVLAPLALTRCLQSKRAKLPTP